MIFLTLLGWALILWGLSRVIEALRFTGSRKPTLVEHVTDELARRRRGA